MARRKASRSQRRARGDSGSDASRRIRWTGVLLFTLALALRLLFWQATPDADWPHSAYFKGDAPTWVDYARSLAVPGAPNFELGLPLRPPGIAYLLAAVWDGHGDLAEAQALWCLLGALTVLLVYDAVRRGFGYAAGLLTGLFCALSQGLMVLSTSLNNETPYLFLVACTLWLSSRARAQSAPWAWAWGGIHGLACLVRVEHVLFFLLTSAWVVATRLDGRRRRLVGTAHMAAALVVVLLPWHLHAWSAIDRFNTQPPDENSATAAAQARLEAALSAVPWSDEAAAERDAWPAFARRAAANFVTATVVYRDGTSRERPSPPSDLRVEAGDLAVLDQAFGSRPAPLPSLPFVTFYGGLNFYLAHNPWADVGFSRAVLDRPPPLDGTFPPLLVNGLPPPNLAFTYPPHLHAVTDGTRMGLRYIASHPGETARRLARRTLRFWDGASLGFGGWGLPAAWPGPASTGDWIRHRADLAVPTTPAFRIWQIAWWLLVLAGLAAAFRHSGSEARTGVWHPVSRLLSGPLVPWLALGATKLVASLAFFGYARHGAGAYPAFALLAALGLLALLGRAGFGATTPRGRRRLVRASVAAGLLFLALEVWRFADPPTLHLDGRAVGTSDPWPLDVHEERVLRLGPDES